MENVRLSDLYEQLMRCRIILFCGEVNENSEADALARLLVLNNEDPITPIRLMISSYGGDACSCWSLVDCIQDNIAAPVFGFVTGKSMSAGAAIMCACDACYVYPRAEIMVHQVQSQLKGSLPDMQKKIKDLENSTEKYLDIISKKTGMSIPELKKRTQDDWNLSAEEAIRLKFCDGYAPKFKNEENVLIQKAEFESSIYWKKANKDLAKIRKSKSN